MTPTAMPPVIGSGATSRVTGAYFADGSQHLDYDTFQRHDARNTTSDFRCALHRFGKPSGFPRLFAESCSSVLRDIQCLLSPGPRKGC